MIEDDALQQQIARFLFERRVNALPRECLPLPATPTSGFRSPGSYIITVFSSSLKCCHARVQNKHFHPPITHDSAFGTGY